MSSRRPVAVVTHAPREADALVARLRAEGAHVIELPCITIEPLDDVSSLASEIASLEAADWLVVTSRAGADAIARVGRLRAAVAAVGVATAARLAEHGITPSFVPSAANGATLARELPRRGRVLLARSDRALPDLPRILRARGFDVRDVVAYRTRVGARGDVEGVRAALEDPDADVVIYVSSPSAVDALVDAIGRPRLLSATILATGLTTLAQLRARLGDDARLQLIDEVLTSVAAG